MRRVALILLPVIVLGLVGVVLVLVMRRRRTMSAEDAARSESAEPPPFDLSQPSESYEQRPSADVLTGYEAHREEEAEFKHGAAQHIREEKLNVRPI
jgi:hypothetical protein